MFTEQFFELLLDFGEDWVVKQVTTNRETNEVDIQIEYFGNGRIYDYAPMRRWRHLDTMQFKTFINCRLPRLNIDGKVKTLAPPWADKHERHSYLFESAVIDVLQATKNQTQTARLMRCPFDVVNRIIHRASSRGMERRQKVKEIYENISVDEKSFQRGHCYATILSHPESERVLEVAAGRTLEACRSLITTTSTDEQRKAVKTISMDLWKAFMTMAAEQLPEAEIIHDKFHLIKYLNEAIDKVRRRETKQHTQLKESRYALLKNKENLTEKQRLKFEEIRAANYEVSRVWEARENFREIFSNASREESEAIFRVWSEAVKESGIKEIMKVEETFANHLRGVLNAMTSKWSNAKAERMNGKIQLLKSIARGYRKFENFRSAILFFYGKLSLFPLNSQ